MLLFKKVDPLAKSKLIKKRVHLSTYCRQLFCILFLFGTSTLHAEWWFDNEYLLWTIKQTSLSTPLVTSASLDDPVPGALGQPGTKVVIGDRKIDTNWRNGFQTTLGAWLECPRIALEATFFTLPTKSHRQSVHTSGEPGSLNIAVPIFDVTGLWGLNGEPGNTIFILPGPLDNKPGFRGVFSLKLSNKLMGSELNASVHLINKCKLRVDFIGGFRWVQFEENLSFFGSTKALPDAPFVEGFYNFKDRFKTNNNFYGPQIGLKADFNVNRWYFKGVAKVALGCMNQTLKISGASQTSNGNLFYMTKNTGNETLPGGIFSEPANRGTHHKNAFAVVVNTQASVAYQFSCNIEVAVGYNFLWMNPVLRPGEQIDRKINPTRTALAQASRDSVGVGPLKPIPFGEPAAAPLPTGSKKPKFRDHSTDFWAQGLVVSLDLKF